MLDTCSLLFLTIILVVMPSVSAIATAPVVYCLYQLPDLKGELRAKVSSSSSQANVGKIVLAKTRYDSGKLLFSREYV